MNLGARAQRGEQTLEIKVIRGPEARARGLKDVDYGVVAYWHPNPLKRLRARLRGVKGKVRLR